MKALITGICGQDGILLSQLLLKSNHEVIGSKLSSEALPVEISDLNIPIFDCDIRDKELVASVLGDTKPDVVFHFAGISSVSQSWIVPSETIQINATGTANLISAIVNHSPQVHLINAASTEIFDSESGVITEDSPLRPLSPYAVSKAAGYQLVQAFRNRGMAFTNAILSNHESIHRPETFVTGKIARAIAEIGAGRRKFLEIGDIEVMKDWSSANDIVAGLKSIADEKFVGDLILAYGAPTGIKSLLEYAFESIGIADFEPYIRVDDSLLRKNESKKMTVSAIKAFEELGWKARTSPREWMQEMVAYHAENLAQPS